MHKYEYLLFVHIKYAEKLCDSNSEINRSNALQEILERSCQLMFESIINLYMVNGDPRFGTLQYYFQAIFKTQSILFRLLRGRLYHLTVVMGGTMGSFLSLKRT